MTTLANRTQGYDLAGNLSLAFSVDRATSYKYKYDHHNRLTGVYDSSGSTRKAAFTWDALGRRVEFWNDVQLATTRYWYDGVNPLTRRRHSSQVLRTANAGAFANVSRAGEVHSYRLSGDGPQAHTPHVFVHGVSYIDERLAMIPTVSEKPYYFVVDRMYNVRMVIDRAGAVVERYAYDSYGRPRIRESCGRGDLNDDTLMTSTDTSRFTDAKNGTIWDPRADMDDDGDVDSNDQTLYDAKQPDWASSIDATAVVAQAFSDADNPYMFQGVPHFALDTAANATEDKLSLNHHRARFADCPTGRWCTKDPIHYNTTLSDNDASFVTRIAQNNRHDLRNSIIRAMSKSPDLLLSRRNPGRPGKTHVGIWPHRPRLTHLAASLNLLSPSLYCYMQQRPTSTLDPTGLRCVAETDMDQNQYTQQECVDILTEDALAGYPGRCCHDGNGNYSYENDLCTKDQFGCPCHLPCVWTMSSFQGSNCVGFEMDTCECDGIV